ncbi:MAG TPA: hypothetical protein PLS90_05410 [Candidatus Sumerlaeota bacterium]|nr:hypothetical protein [Candidatus Sumerlaeota bacterium]HPK01874.1 hypothetical protein [Candidatus Sumerlaeota bacterium]
MRPAFNRHLGQRPLVALLLCYLLLALAILHGGGPRQAGSLRGTGIREAPDDEAVLPGILRAPLMLTRTVPAGSDTLGHDYPAWLWGWSQIRRTKQIPLWNPCLFAGMPFLASQMFMPFYPFNWLGAVLPFPLAFNIQYPLHLVLAALVMAFTVRRRRMTWWTAFLVGIAWGFGSHLATLAGPGHLQKLQALAWLPLVAWGGACLGRGAGRAGALALGAGLALQITAGHLQIVYLSLLVALLEALAALAVAFLRPRDPAPAALSRLQRRRALARSLGWTALGLAGALGLSAVVLIPTLEFARISNRQGSLSWDEATRGSLPPEEKFEFIFPRLLGDSMPAGRGPYLGRYGETDSGATPERIVSDYVGAGVLLFSLLALALPGRRRVALAWLLLAAGALILSIGRYYAGLYRFLLDWLPGLAHFRSPSTSMAVLSYALAMAAAQGVECWLAEGRNRAHASRGPAGWIGHGMILLAAGAAALALVAAFWLRDARQADLPRAVAQAAAALHTFRFLALVAGVAGLWRMVRRGERAARPWIAPALLGVLALVWAWDLVLNVRPFWTVEAAAPYERHIQHHWAERVWRSEARPVRFLVPGRELQNWAMTYTGTGPGPIISSISGYHPVVLDVYESFIERLGFLHPNLLRLLAVNYLVWPDDPDLPFPEGYLPVSRMSGEVLLHNPQYPYVRPIRHFREVASLDALLDRLEDPRFQPYESTLVLEEGKHPKSLLKGTPEATHLSAEATSIAPGDVTIQIRTRNWGAVALSELAVPGWRIQPVDPAAGVRIEPFIADGLLLGFAFPAGRHTVRCTYDPVSQRLGLYITLVTLAALACAAGRKLAERRRAGTQPATGEAWTS